MALLKRTVKDLAVKFADLRPKPHDSYEHILWDAMVMATAQKAIPMVWEHAFISACYTFGVWNKDHEGVIINH